MVDKEQFATYNSLIVGHAITLSILNKILPISNSNKLNILRIITVLALSAVFTAFLFWIKERFELLAASLVLLMILSSYWLILFGKNLWWSLGNFYLPFVLLLYFFEKTLTLRVSTKSYSYYPLLFYSLNASIQDMNTLPQQLLWLLAL